MGLPLVMKPTAILPIAMSLAAMALVLGHVALYGVVRETDEGTPAHLFQLLMVLQVPIVVVFAARWLPRRPISALFVLGIQGVFGLAAIVLVELLT